MYISIRMVVKEGERTAQLWIECCCRAGTAHSSYGSQRTSLRLSFVSICTLKPTPVLTATHTHMHVVAPFFSCSFQTQPSLVLCFGACTFYFCRKSVVLPFSIMARAAELRGTQSRRKPVTGRNPRFPRASGRILFDNCYVETTSKSLKIRNSDVTKGST